jgi:hypothetical protein
LVSKPTFVSNWRARPSASDGFHLFHDPRSDGDIVQNIQVRKEIKGLEDHAGAQPQLALALAFLAVARRMAALNCHRRRW